ncbi:AMP-binding enzyme family protein (macronuclear) [Tetrahymena thermophila SB210]|uniref:AMP-binding enzyme family protein n=1 Tax=Tetrahymena thermophila (strain SB210) TaxID=312017 RepID=I7LTA8_TETTS|nr:AMP-binding enzyme family protein [Tetrahymena thermophila SB210]EAR84909.2 AMP-binding enzyme family protein [Tetrahymena thermophila SB210]|eukprot:XP_001032572.2 AMP-binding enzyme family protein [Tetrahymena thermophila SB210]
MDPKFRSQSFIVNDRIEIPLSQDLFGFAFNYNQTFTIDQYQQSQNLTYLVYIAYFQYADPVTNDYQFIYLDINNCTDPQLEGLLCVDYSKIKNYTLVLDVNNNIGSEININLYGCNDIDYIKTTKPNNCASQQDIDAVINGFAANFYMKLKVQQYNTTSKQIQTNYRRIYNYVISNQYFLNSIHTQKQETEVSKGLLYQTKETYSSPIQYDQYTQAFDRQLSLQTGLGPYACVSLYMDEVVQQFQIQYPTITEILALVNSVAAIFMISKVIGRYCSQNLIQQDFFMVAITTIFQDTYQKLIKQTNLIDQKDENLLKVDFCTENFDQDTQEKNQVEEVAIPDFLTKSRESVEKSQAINQAQEYSNFLLQLSNKQSNNNQHVDEVITHEEQRQFQTKQNRQQRIGSLQNQIKGHQNKQIHLLTESPLIQSQIQLQNFTKFQPSVINKSSLQKSEISQIKSDQINSIQVKEELIKSLNQSNLKNEVAFKIKTKYGNSVQRQIQNLIFKFKCFKSKKFKYCEGVNQLLINKIKQEVNTNLDIFQFYKDNLFLKKALSILLTKDQLAAIQLVSLTENFFDIDLRKKEVESNYQKTKGKLNHFEKQYLIMQSEYLQAKYIEKFFKKLKDEDQQLSQVDLRIISSIIQKKQKI